MGILAYGVPYSIFLSVEGIRTGRSGHHTLGIMRWCTSKDFNVMSSIPLPTPPPTPVTQYSIRWGAPWKYSGSALLTTVATTEFYGIIVILNKTQILYSGDEITQFSCISVVEICDFLSYVQFISWVGFDVLTFKNIGLSASQIFI